MPLLHFKLSFAESCEAGSDAGNTERKEAEKRKGGRNREKRIAS